MKKYLKQLKANKKGFTLIEMIVVIAIIGILAAILVPSMAGYLKTSKESKEEANAKIVYTAAEAAFTSLETSTTPLKGGTYTKDDSTGNMVNAEDNDGATNLTDKLKDLIGATNYEKISVLEITIDDGAITEVKIQENDDAKEITYPK